MLYHSQRYTKKVSSMTALCLLLAGSSVLAAQQPDAGNILRNTQESEVKVPMPTPPSITIKEGTEQPPAAGGQAVTVSRFHITGQEIFPEAELTALLRDSVGKKLTLVELNQRVGRISQYFRSHGYIVARAFLPVQESKEGEITIEVVVGKYGQIDIRNHSRLFTSSIQGVVSPLKSGDTISQEKLERVLLLLSDTSGISLKSTMAPGKEPGTSDLILEVRDTASIKGQVYSDNWGNRFTGDLRGGLNITLNNPDKIGDSLTVGGLYAGSGMNNWSTVYSVPTGHNGAKFGAGYSRVSYLLGEDYASLDASGIAKTTSLYETYPLLRSRHANLNVRLGYDHKDLSDQTDSSDSQKQANVVSLGLSGDHTDSAGDGITGFDFTVSNGHLKLNSTDAITNDASAQTTGGYTKGTLNLQRQKYLNSRLNYVLSFTGQLASKNLDSSEKFFLGGASGVRAYPQGEAAGDSGYLFTGELRWNMPTPQFQVAAFLDNGHVTLNKSPWDTSTSNSRSLTGAGLGLIFSRSNDYSLRMDYAWKLSSASAQSDTDKSSRLWIRGTTYF